MTEKKTGYRKLDYESVLRFCRRVFQGYGFSEKESGIITDVLLTADLYGIESHGIQRLIRYHKEIEAGFVDINAKPEIVFETPLTAVIEGHDAMGQILSRNSMNLAIDKAKKSGIGIVTVRNSNHFGIAGYYSKMAADADLIGITMTNSEAIMVPTYARQAMLGTNPIAFSMPAYPTPFLFDAATTVIPRGKLEVYKKRGVNAPKGLIVDENGNDSTDPARVLANIIAKSGGGILPLGGSGTETGGHKGYGFGMICEIFTSILSYGVTSNYIFRTPGRCDVCSGFWAIDYGLFGDKTQLKNNFSKFLNEMRTAEKASGCDRVYIHGEPEFESKEKVLKEGVPVNEQTLSEMHMIGKYTGADPLILEFVE